jgi:hypothetical protein
MYLHMVVLGFSDGHWYNSMLTIACRAAAAAVKGVCGCAMFVHSSSHVRGY